MVLVVIVCHTEVHLPVSWFPCENHDTRYRRILACRTKNAHTPNIQGHEINEPHQSVHESSRAERSAFSSPDLMDINAQKKQRDIRFRRRDGHQCAKEAKGHQVQEERADTCSRVAIQNPAMVASELMMREHSRLTRRVSK